MEASIDSETAHSGKRSLRLRFDRTENLAGFGIYQSVYLKPGRYRLRAWVKAQDIGTDQGIVIQVGDVAGGPFGTEPILGTTDWKLVEAGFTVPAGGGLHTVQLGRKTSKKFDDKVSGTLWIDEVSIRAEGR